MNATELRVRSKVSDEAIAPIVGKIVDDGAYDVLLTGPTNVYGPTGQLIAKYLPGALLGDSLLEDTYEVLHGLKVHQSYNRGYASGTPRLVRQGGTRSYTEPVPSAIIGSVDPMQQLRYCRLTAWSGKEVDQFSSLFPLFRRIGKLFGENVPDRFEAQMAFIKRTQPDWVIADTPFTTITVNNSYPTGVHTDKGDLDEGFSNLAVLRRGNYVGGVFVFPQYRVGVDMKHGDLLLMDAHQWHGNTAMYCGVCSERMGPGGATDHDTRCDVERISIVSYYRTKMVECGTAEEEAERAREWTEKRAALAESSNPLLDAMAEEAYGGG